MAHWFSKLADGKPDPGQLRALELQIKMLKDKRDFLPRQIELLRRENADLPRQINALQKQLDSLRSR